MNLKELRRRHKATKATANLDLKRYGSAFLESRTIDVNSIEQPRPCGSREHEKGKGKREKGKGKREKGKGLSIVRTKYV